MPQENSLKTLFIALFILVCVVNGLILTCSRNTKFKRKVTPYLFGLTAICFLGIPIAESGFREYLFFFVPVVIGAMASLAKHVWASPSLLKGMMGK